MCNAIVNAVTPFERAAVNNETDTPTLNRFVLSSDNLPADLDDRARELLWVEQLEALLGSFSVVWSKDHPFEAHMTLTDFGDVQLLETRTTAMRVIRTVQNLEEDGASDFFLNLNPGSGRLRAEQRGQTLELPQGAMGLTTRGATGVLESEPLNPVWAVSVPRAMLSELIEKPDDFVLRAFDPDAPATQLLKDYLTILFRRDDLGKDLALVGHVSRTLTDLIALALGANRDAAELASARGTRAARLQMILAGIQAEFDNPQFSAQTLGTRLGLSPGYIQNLVGETGRPFMDRVLELRLQKARKILSDPNCAGMKVSDIAYACGFNDVSYFNRRFRQRFDASPTQYRQ